MSVSDHGTVDNDNDKVHSLVQCLMHWLYSFH